MKTMLARRIAALFLLFATLAAAPASTVAATGSAVPSFTYPTLHIPRIDVEGFGALEVELLLSDQANLVFTLVFTQAASAALAPGATYDLQSGVLDIPLVRIGTAFHDVQLISLGAGQFQATSIIAAMVPGQSGYQQMCAGCHGADGLGGTVGVSLHNCAFCSSLDVLDAYIDANMPLGMPGLCIDGCASDVASYIATAFAAGQPSQLTGTLEALTILAPADTLRKASLQLLSRLPTAAELALVASNGEAGLSSAIDAMLEEPAFQRRLGEIFNDRLHTNRYLSTNGAEAALNLMTGRFPNARWFDPGESLRGADYQANRITTNNSVASEPLELLAYIVQNDLPASEFLTADYFMVNGYSAKSYGLTGVVFDDEWDPAEFRPATLPGLPHAGILSSLMFLNRYPTSATNRNRARSRVVYDLFLDVDILGLDGVRPDGSAVDISSPAPTMENPDCVKCHSLLDPVASAFKDWNRRGYYAPMRFWYQDMFQAGFAGTDLPNAQARTATQWLGEQIALDPRFDTAMTRILYRGLTGSEPLAPPGAEATTASTEAYLAESASLNAITELYVADNRNLKTLAREIVLSPYWRASGLADAGFAQVHADTGAAVLLTPELLHRKIAALFGFEWRGPLDQYSTNKALAGTARLLDARQHYQQIYGGINSFAITERLSDPNGLMVLVQERMANELACYAVPHDFLAAASARRLFPFVETTTTLASAQGQSAVRNNIRHLHQYLLGENLDPAAAEITSTYQLFAAVLQDGQGKLGNGESSALPSRCQRNRDLLTGASLNVAGNDGRLVSDPAYVIRAWMAVVAYLLSDYRFVYE